MSPRQDEMEDTLAEAYQAMDEGSKWPGMTYEQGVAATLEWVMGRSGNPMKDGDETS